mmetsp:Transcript_35675/g.55704  ORF Transcript_35675/g.55704 Transcript_35675/m.55704 type:complete len:115 (-) Transcript_35675:40-384(-)
MISALRFAEFGQDTVLLAGGSDKRVLVSQLPRADSGVDPLSDLSPALREALSESQAPSGGGGVKSTVKRLLGLKCTSQVNAIESTAEGRVYVGDLGAGILEFDLCAAVVPQPET